MDYDNDLISLPGAARQMNVSVPCAYNWADYGLFRTVKVAGKVFAIKSSLPRVHKVTRKNGVFLEYPHDFWSDEEIDEVLERNPHVRAVGR